tara:strand:- start:629 stop:886 length:258 start_codon:yes stop_codon:yes gene_type:complete
VPQGVTPADADVAEQWQSSNVPAQLLTEAQRVRQAHPVEMSLGRQMYHLFLQPTYSIGRDQGKRIRKVLEEPLVRFVNRAASTCA